MSIGVLSIVALIAVIAVAFVRKANAGICAIFAATILAIFMDVPQKDVIAGFGSNLFITLLGICLLCTIAQVNGSLELFAKKCVSRIGSRTWLAPIVVWLIGVVLSGVGPGSIPTLGVVSAIAMPVAYATGYDPIMMGIIGQVGIFCGRFTPFTSDSSVILALTQEQGITGYQTQLFIYALITSIIIAVVMFFAFGGHKVKANKGGLSGDTEKFNREQTFTLIGFLIVIFLTVVLKWNIGLSSFAVVAVLVILGVIDEKKALKSVPWGVLLMVTGVGILMNLVITAGGIDLIVNALGSIMTSRTAAPLIGISAGVMSWFSSATGVVFPTMIPTVSGLVEKMNGTVSASTFLSMIAIGAAYAGLSPASTGGGLILATRATADDFTKEEEDKAFIKLFIVSAGALLIIAALALIGLYGILG